MKFRLTYEGDMFGASQRKTRAGHKHEIRRALHPQLKQLWAANRYLRESEIEIDPKKHKSAKRIPSSRTPWGSSAKRGPMAQVLADRYENFGYRFVPLVRGDLSVTCSIDILFLRRDVPGAVIKSGDIDNRLKTFLDALRMPRSAGELGGANPRRGENPFYCLLEDDSLITRVALETDVLLDPLKKQDVNKVRLVVTVDVRPYIVHMDNLCFD